MSLDAYSEPTLNYAWGIVYLGTVRGMCLDLLWQPQAETELSAEIRETQYIEMLPVDQVEGPSMLQFDKQFFAVGGLVGGW